MLLLTNMQPRAKVAIWSLEKSWPVGQMERSWSPIYVDMPLVMLSESHFKGKKKMNSWMRTSSSFGFTIAQSEVRSKIHSHQWIKPKFWTGINILELLESLESRPKFCNSDSSPRSCEVFLIKKLFYSNNTRPQNLSFSLQLCFITCEQSRLIPSGQAFKAALQHLHESLWHMGDIYMYFFQVRVKKKNSQDLYLLRPGCTPLSRQKEVNNIGD